MPRPVLPCVSILSRVQICIRLGLNHTKKDFLSRFARSIKSVEAARNSSSIVSIRFLVSGPVSSHFCLPQVPKRGSSPGVSVATATHFITPRGPKLRLERWILRIVRIFRFIFGIQMIEVAEEFVETMHGG